MCIVCHFTSSVLEFEKHDHCNSWTFFWITCSWSWSINNSLRPLNTLGRKVLTIVFYLATNFKWPQLCETFVYVFYSTFANKHFSLYIYQKISTCAYLYSTIIFYTIFFYKFDTLRWKKECWHWVVNSTITNLHLKPYPLLSPDGG